MIEVRIPIPLHEYHEVRDDLERSLDAQDMPVWLCADTVIRTWAGLNFFDWFDTQNAPVDVFIGWGEIQCDDVKENMVAAFEAYFVNEDNRPVIVMIFEELEQGIDSDDQEPMTKRSNDLAVLFKLTFGGA